MRSGKTLQVSRRFFGSGREEIGNYTLSRGSVGRKVFGKGWKHLQARYPVNLQERWHRASVERLFHPSMIENIINKEIGEKDSKDYRMFFNLNCNFNHDNDNDNEYSNLSPWHDIPFGFQSNDGNIYFNFINEISKNDRAKMECCLNEEWNPIKQDIKKGNLRYFKYGDLPFNYGFISQTWENPHLESCYSDIKGLKGDNDPIDVIEISKNSLSRGTIIPIKVISLLGLIDEGETDWKIIGINANDERAHLINSINDANNILQTDFSGIILDWFRNYKVPDGKEQNKFSHNEEYQSKEMAIEVIEECHRHWLDLILGATNENEKNDICLTSVTQKHLMAQGLTSKHDIGQLPKIEYPRYEDWRADTGRTIADVDNSRDDFDLDEESPDQRRSS